MSSNPKSEAARKRLWAKQVKERGFSDLEMWGLFYHLAKHIHPRLAHFRKYHLTGHPGTISMKQWEDKVDAMVEAFRLIIDEEYSYNASDIETYRKNQATITKGLRLFGTWFQTLWD